MKRKVSFIFIIVLTLIPYLTSFANWFFTPADVNALHSKPANYTINYGSDPKQIAQLRLPETPGPHPVAMIIHGGCWTHAFADLNNTAALADALRDLGFATWNIEYRGLDDKGGAFPGTFEDVANAADYLRTIATKYSLDLNKIIVIGHSAGGHLALWLAGRHNLPTNSPLYKANPISFRGIISLGGVPDLQSFRKHSQDICGTDIVSALLGPKEDEITKRLPQTSPAAMLPLQMEQILIYGTDDKVTPDDLSSYIKASKRAGDRIKLIKIPFAAHFEYLVPNSVTWPILVYEARSLISDPSQAVG